MSGVVFEKSQQISLNELIERLQALQDDTGSWNVEVGTTDGENVIVDLRGSATLTCGEHVLKYDPVKERKERQIKELKATIEKASKEVAELERGI